MNNVESQYFALLRSALWGIPFSSQELVDWEGVMQIAEHHGNSVLLADIAVRLPNGSQPQDVMLVTMRQAMRNNLMRQLRLRQILVAAVKLLRDHGIECVALKGYGLASLYLNPALRQFGDIDLYVGLNRFHEACKLLRTLPGGYNWGEEVEVGHHYNIEFGGCPLEIHRVSADVEDEKEAAIYAAIEQDGLAEHPQCIYLDGFPVSVPSKEFMVFFTFFHAWHHFMTTGVGWRQISDVAMALHAYHGQLDLDKLKRWLASMHLMQPWQTFGWLIVDRLGLPEAEMPFYDAASRRRAQRLYRRIMEEGNFMRKNTFKRRKPHKAGLRRKLHAFACIFVDFHHVARVFPDAAFREMRTVLRNGMKKNFRK